MKLTYLFHSGFLLETEQCFVIFDYFFDPSKTINKILKSDKPLYVLASHFHDDHFNPKILRWRKEKNNITYILSKDIYRQRKATKEDADIWLAKGGEWSNEHMHVWAAGSNDSGVSWIVETEGKRIFHAGDLNNWYARLLNENPARCNFLNDVGERVDPVYEEKRYIGELKDIEKIATSFDVVMFPIDARIGNGYTKGARQFLERFEVGLFVPMHFVVCGRASAYRMREFAEARNVSFWAISDNGDSLSF